MPVSSNRVLDACWLLKLLRWRCFIPEWLHYALHSSASSNITHIFLGTKLSNSIPLAFQSSPGETITNHLHSASDLFSSKSSTKAGTAAFLSEHPPPPPPQCPCPQFTSVSLFYHPAGWGSCRSSTVGNYSRRKSRTTIHTSFLSPHPSFPPPSDSVQMPVDTYFTCTLSDTLWLRGGITGDHSFSDTLPKVLWQ